MHNFHNFAVAPRFGFGWYENWVDRLLLKSTKLFISVSRSCAESLKVRSTFENLNNSRCIYNGINDASTQENDFNIRDSLGIGNNPLCIMLGNYEPRKGHQFIFEAFRLVEQDVPNAHLVVCGGGTKDEVAEVKNIKEKIISNGNVHLLEFIPDGASLISQADLLLIGSQEFESFGLTAVESMIRKKPIVSTDTGLNLSANIVANISEEHIIKIENPSDKIAVVPGTNQDVLFKLNNTGNLVETVTVTINIEGKLLKIGRKLAYTQVDLTSEDGKLIATGRHTKAL
jgi:glycosyltransferase involved in cell wall biosynthesis